MLVPSCAEFSLAKDLPAIATIVEPAIKSIEMDPFLVRFASEEEATRAQWAVDSSPVDGQRRSAFGPTASSAQRRKANESFSKIIRLVRFK